MDATELKKIVDEAVVVQGRNVILRYSNVWIHHRTLSDEECKDTEGRLRIIVAGIAQGAALCSRQS